MWEKNMNAAFMFLERLNKHLFALLTIITRSKEKESGVTDKEHMRVNHENVCIE